MGLRKSRYLKFRRARPQCCILLFLCTLGLSHRTVHDSFAEGQDFHSSPFNFHTILYLPSKYSPPPALCVFFLLLWIFSIISESNRCISLKLIHGKQLDQAMVMVHHGSFFFAMIKWCTRQTRLALICEVTRYRRFITSFKWWPWQNMHFRPAKSWRNFQRWGESIPEKVYPIDFQIKNFQLYISWKGKSGLLTDKLQKQTRSLLNRKNNKKQMAPLYKPKKKKTWCRSKLFFLRWCDDTFLSSKALLKMVAKAMAISIRMKVVLPENIWCF